MLVHYDPPLTDGATYYYNVIVKDFEGNRSITSERFVHSDCPAVPPLKNEEQYYSTLQAAYDASNDGDIILNQEGTLTGDLTADRNISVTMSVGYDCGYVNGNRTTKINGDVTVNDGTLIIDGGTLIIE